MGAQDLSISACHVQKTLFHSGPQTSGSYNPSFLSSICKKFLKDTLGIPDPGYVIRAK